MVSKYGNVLCKDALANFSAARVRFKNVLTKRDLNTRTDMLLDLNACTVKFCHCI